MGFFRKEREQSVARLKKAVDSGKIALGDFLRVANEGSTHDPRLIKDEKEPEARRKRESDGDEQ